jgi:hypothetical protein
METINNILKPIIGFLLVFSFVLAFSSCEKKRTEADYKDTVIRRDTIAVNNQEETSDWKTKMKEESRDIDIRIDSLRAKAKRKGKKAEKEMNLAIDNLKREKEHVSSSDTGDKAKENWEKFKEKSKAALDSLEKKF